MVFTAVLVFRNGVILRKRGGELGITVFVIARIRSGHWLILEKNALNTEVVCGLMSS